MALAKKAAPAVSAAKLRPLLKPIVDPVIARLERNERLLLELKAALDVQFKRTADIQAQLDILLVRLGKGQK